MALVLPWHLLGPKATDLQTIIIGLWDYCALELNKITRINFIATMPDEGISILWDELPFKHDIAIADRRDFLLNYAQYMQWLGTRSGVMLAQSIFHLAEFEVIELGRLAPYHPYFVRLVRFTQTASDARVIQYITDVSPARCKFHTLFAPPRLIGGLGGAKLGRNLGGTQVH